MPTMVMSDHESNKYVIVKDWDKDIMVVNCPS